MNDYRRAKQGLQKDLRHRRRWSILIDGFVTDDGETVPCLGSGILLLCGPATAKKMLSTRLCERSGQIHGKCLLKLDTVRLRISRWGMAVGLSPELHLKLQTSASNKDIRLAQSLLEQILETFKDIERISERFKKHTTIQNPRSGDLIVYNATSNMDSDYRRLHLTIRELTLKRQKETSIFKKAAWVLYEKKRFEGIITDVNNLATQLIDLFTAVQDDRRALYTTEASAINRSQELALLQNAINEEDQIFSNEIKKELERRGHNFTDWRADGGSKI